VTIDTTKYSDGPHWLLAEAIDTAQNTGTSGPINVIFNNNGGSLPPPPDTTPPAVSISSPASGTVSGTVNVSANASDNVAVARLDFLVDGALASSDTTSPYGFSWDSTKLANGSHTLTANAYDTSNNVASASIVVNVSNGDTTPPSTPIGVAATAGAYNQVNLAWSASSDNVGVAGYYIVRGGVTIAQTAGTTYSDTTVNASSSYTYQVMAYDAAGNTSALSAGSSVTTPSAPDTSAPTAPTNLAAAAISSSQINLSWTASTDNVGVKTYDIYRGSSKIASIAAPATSFGDSGLSAGTTFSYYVVARDAAGNSSANSSTAAATTQSAPPVNTWGSINGIVSSNKGGGLAGTTITISYSGSRHNYTSASDGSYSIASVPPGGYTVKYGHQGYNSQSVNLSVTAGAITTKNITLISRK
jgi:chitodextrinase